MESPRGNVPCFPVLWPNAGIGTVPTGKTGTGTYQFRYLQTKKERDARKGQKLTLLREVRVRPRIGEHDIEAKKHQVKRLLNEGSKVKITVMFRGREMTHQDIGVELLRRMADAFKDEAKLEKAPSLEGRRLSIIIVPTNQRPKTEKESEEIANA